MSSEIKQSNILRFHIHDVEHVVDLAADEIDPFLSLNTYIRNVLGLTGTKKLCLEGGCGSCIVSLRRVVNGKNVHIAVNSCLVALLSCQGWNIETIEGIGGPTSKYHPVQQVLAKFNGTQCGFCSSGMVMNMYALYESNPQLTMAEVENSFGGNICRCTGYRPILAAFKSLCVDANSDVLGHYPDIEDLKKCNQKECKKACDKKCGELVGPMYHDLADDTTWVKATTLAQIFDTLKANTAKYMLVAGNTAKGVFPETYGRYIQEPVKLFIDISDVPELKQIQENTNDFVFGASNSLTTAIQQFAALAKSNPGKFSYMQKLSDHIDLVANVPVRNIGTVAGNLMMKHDRNDFPSDVFLSLEACGARVVIADGSNTTVQLAPQDFIHTDMKNKVIQSVIFPAHASNVKYESYKIMPRAQNTHANVNAGFLFDFDTTNVLRTVSIVIGNINPQFVHATKTEQYLLGKRFDYNTMQAAFDILANELNPNVEPPDPTPAFRKQLAIALFYKTILAVAPVTITPRIKSGGPKLLRPPVSKAAQDYTTNQTLYPLTQAIPKIEALAQTTGQAEYIGDMPDMPRQLFAAFVLAQAPPTSEIVSIDPSPARDVKGYESFFKASDIPGQNSYKFFGATEEIFCSKTVLYYDQPIGLIVTSIESALREAVSKVKVTYNPPKTDHPMLTVRQIMRENVQGRIREQMTLTPSRRGNDIRQVVKGQFDIYQQYHFHMETQCCNVVPIENDCLNVYPSTQFIVSCQTTMARMLNIPQSKINISVRRLGGAFGAKITRSQMVSCAAALAAWKLRRPVKMSLSLPDNMKIFGKRWPLCMDYEAGVNAQGVIQYLEVHQYSDLGAVRDEMGVYEQTNLFTSSYDSSTFYVHVNTAITDTSVNTWARAPGSTEGLAAIEAIMDHIAYEMKIDPLELRRLNTGNHQVTKNYINDIKSWAEIDQRKTVIAAFNRDNRWKKKGMAVVPMAWGFGIGGLFSAVVSVFRDGSVSITHGGIEMGQGINTKVAQVCAYKLKIPLERITVVPSTSIACPNNAVSGASMTSEAMCYATTVACDTVLTRLRPYANRGRWEDQVSAAVGANVVLSVTGSCTSNQPGVGYQIFGICATEVTVDILTGQHIIDRVDLIEDAGQAISPLIDIGQVEGAFIMGVGYQTTERIVHDEKTGRLLTTNTWTYHPPGAKDIPVNFRVRFPNTPNNNGILQSKATAEPPLCLSVSVPLAIRNAVASARIDAKPTGTSPWFPFDGPTTVENTFMNSLNDYKAYSF